MFKTPILAAAFAVLGLSVAQAADYQESTFWQSDVDAGSLPPVAERVPDAPKIVDLKLRNRELGQQGGTLRTMVTRSKDVRQMVVYGYGRLVGFNERYELVADILKSFENEDDKKFTLHLRPGHKWSDGNPFTSEDFRYFWENVANNELLSPSGPVDFLRVEGELPTVSFPDAHTVIYEWSKPNPQFLQMLAEARPPFIYRPSHYLKSYHADFTDEEELADGTDPLSRFSCRTGCVLSFDVDGNLEAQPLTDGLLVMRHLFGFSGDALISDAVSVGANRESSEAIAEYLAEGDLELDIDGNGKAEPLTDGLLLIRYLYKFSGEFLIKGAIGAGAKRNTAEEVEAYIKERVPAD